MGLNENLPAPVDDRGPIREWIAENQAALAGAATSLALIVAAHMGWATSERSLADIAAVVNLMIMMIVNTRTTSTKTAERRVVAALAVPTEVGTHVASLMGYNDLDMLIGGLETEMAKVLPPKQPVITGPSVTNAPVTTWTTGSTATITPIASPPPPPPPPPAPTPVPSPLPPPVDGAPAEKTSVPGQPRVGLTGSKDIVIGPPSAPAAPDLAPGFNPGAPPFATPQGPQADPPPPPEGPSASPAGLTVTPAGLLVPEQEASTR